MKTKLIALGSVALLVGVIIFVDYVFIGDELAEELERERREMTLLAEEFKFELSSAIKKADRIEIVEHSSRFDFNQWEDAPRFEY